MKAFEVIIYFIGALFCHFNLLLIFSNLEKEKLKLNQKITLLLLIVATINTFIYLIGVVSIKTITTLLLILSINKIVFRKSWTKTSFLSIYIWLFGMLFDIIFMIGYVIVSKIVTISTIGYCPIIITFVATIILEVIYYFCSRTNLFQKLAKKLYNIFIKNKMFVVSILVMLFAYFGSQAVLNLNHFNKFVMIIFLATLTILNLTQNIIYNYLKSVLKETNNILINNNQFYLDLNLNTRQFKHNLIHELNGVKSYGNSKANALINEIIKETCLLKVSNIELDKLPSGLNGFIQSKIYNCSEKIDIVVNNKVYKDILTLISSQTYNNLCKTIGICIDNALEALSDASRKILLIELTDYKNQIEIIIQNSFSSYLDVDKLATLNYSTKGQSRGIGLFSVLVCEDIKTKIRIVNDIFETKITVSKETYHAN